MLNSKVEGYLERFLEQKMLKTENIYYVDWQSSFFLSLFSLVKILIFALGLHLPTVKLCDQLLSLLSEGLKNTKGLFER